MYYCISGSGYLWRDILHQAYLNKGSVVKRVTICQLPADFATLRHLGPTLAKFTIAHSTIWLSGALSFMAYSKGDGTNILKVDTCESACVSC